MKKTILLTLLLISVFSVSVFAQDIAISTPTVTSAAGMIIKGGTSNTTAAASTNPMGKMSTGVYLGVDFTTTTYAIITKHQTGSKKVGTSSDSTAIFFMTEPAGVLASGSAPQAADQTAFPTTAGWTSM